MFIIDFNYNLNKKHYTKKRLKSKEPLIIKESTDINAKKVNYEPCKHELN